MPSLLTQTRYWRKHPPVHLLVAAYLDYKPGADSGAGSAPGARSSAANDASIEALMAFAPPMPEHLIARIPRHV